MDIGSSLARNAKNPLCLPLSSRETSSVDAFLSRHFLSHGEQKLPVTFLHPSQMAPRPRQGARVLPGRAPHDVIRCFPFWKIWKFGRFVAVVKELVDGHL